MIPPPLRVTFIITGLETGGAETMLYRLVKSLDRSEILPKVISLTGKGVFFARFAELGVDTQWMEMKNAISAPRTIWMLNRLLRQQQPDIVQTWMYHADLVGGLTGYLAGRLPVVWNIRNSNLDSATSKCSTQLTVRLCGLLSRWLPRKIVVCSETARQVHAGLGYVGEKMIVIPNGFDLDAFKPEPAARERLLKELKLQRDAVLIGLAARFDPQKDHHNFLLAAAEVGRRFPKAHFVLCGDGITSENSLLAGWVKESRLPERIHLLGRREDMPAFMAALDVAVSASAYGEAFPNVLGEAMACGVPCAATDVGDSAFIIGETGRVVQPRDPAALAGALTELVEMGSDARETLGQAARRRVAERFNLPEIISKYSRLYREIVTEKYS